MAIPTASASVTNDIEFTLISNTDTNQQESASLGYSTAFAHGIGADQIDYGLFASGSIASGDSLKLDFTALDKESFGVTATIDFNRVKGIIIENRSTITGSILSVEGSGIDGIGDPWVAFPGGSVVKRNTTWEYVDTNSGIVILPANKGLWLNDLGGSGIDRSMIVVGITGVI